MKRSLLLILVFASCCLGWRKQAQQKETLQGDWTLVFINVPQPDSAAVFMERSPAIRFDTATHRSSGTTGCNRFSSFYSVDKTNMDVDMEKMALTRMACHGDGERIFLDALKKISQFSISGNILSMSDGKSVIMRWKKNN